VAFLFDMRSNLRSPNDLRPQVAPATAQRNDMTKPGMNNMDKGSMNNSTSGMSNDSMSKNNPKKEMSKDGSPAAGSKETKK
jgi:hypothetical protein